ncbi:hypothetical protein [Algimonas arctica]|uniref:hypothetical protein n=1 Tax=Algimonas arctica TaxID=1479486 RepID=UPI001674A22A|nr:hypothetical protein [Algimonas arctica]
MTSPIWRLCFLINFKAVGCISCVRFVLNGAVFTNPFAILPMTKPTQEFQETLRRMLESPPKENKTLKETKNEKKGSRKNSKSSAANDLD